MTKARLIVIGHPPFMEGGTGPLAHHVLTNLSAAGYHVRAIHPIFPGHSWWREEYARRYPQIQVAWYEMPPFGDPFECVPTEELEMQRDRAHAALHAMLAKLPADLVYVHEESLIWGLQPLVQKYDLRCLAVLHGNLLAMVNGVMNADGAQQWIDLFRTPDLIICGSEHMAATLRQAGLTNIEVMLNSVDIGTFQPANRSVNLADELRISQDDIVVLHASNLRQIKRPLDLVRASAMALVEEPRLLLLIVGTGALRRGIEDEACQLGIDHRIRFTEWVDHSMMPGYFSLADFSVITSASEGLPLVGLESMASGRPVIASDIPAAREFISHGLDGFLFPVGQIDALAKFILELSDADRCGRMGAAARSKIVQGYDSDSMNRRQLELIGRLVNGA